MVYRAKAITTERQLVIYMKYILTIQNRKASNLLFFFIPADIMADRTNRYLANELGFMIDSSSRYFCQTVSDK